MIEYLYKFSKKILPPPFIFLHTTTHKACNRGILPEMTDTCVQAWLGEKREINKPLKVTQLTLKQED